MAREDSSFAEFFSFLVSAADGIQSRSLMAEIERTDAKR